MSIDYVGRTAVLELEVWVGNDSKERSLREAYRRVRLSFSGLMLCVVDAPNREYLEEQPIGLGIDAAPADAIADSAWPAEPLPEGAFRRSFFFTDEANSFLHIAALAVNLTWLSEPRVIY